MNAVKEQVYLDYNAGAPLRPAAGEAMFAVLRSGGNASAVHGFGRKARGRIEAAREIVARLVGARPKYVIFTSGGTEANVTALSPSWVRDGAPLSISRLFVSAVEHPSVLSGGRFRADAIARVPVSSDGIVNVPALLAMVDEENKAERVPLVSIMAANSETGVLQPIEQVGDALSGRDAVFHVDAVQAAGRLPIDIKAWKADAISLSAHKIGGPQGAGALVLGRDELRPAPLLTGGSQENRHRAGTENVAAIAGFGEAARIALDELTDGADLMAVRALRIRLEHELRHIWPDTVVFGECAERLGNTCAFAVPGISAETALIALDIEGFAVSSGSACSSGKVARSHVLLAMGVADDLAGGAVRVSLGWATKAEDVEGFIAAWRKISGRMRPVGTGKAA